MQRAPSELNAGVMRQRKWKWKWKWEGPTEAQQRSAPTVAVKVNPALGTALRDRLSQRHAIINDTLLSLLLALSSSLSLTRLLPPWTGHVSTSPLRSTGSNGWSRLVAESMVTCTAQQHDVPTLEYHDPVVLSLADHLYTRRAKQVSRAQSVCSNQLCSCH